MWLQFQFSKSSLLLQGPVESAEFKVGDQTFPYPYDNKTTTMDTDVEGKLLKENKEDKAKANAPLDPTVPKFRLVHRGHIDLQNFTHARLSKQ